MNLSTSTQNQIASRLMCVPLALICIWSFSIAAMAQTPGLLDPNFNTSGYNIVDLSGNSENDAAVGISLQGSFGSSTYFVLGSAGAPNSADRAYSLAKFGSDGGLQEDAQHELSASDDSEARACQRKPSSIPLLSNFYVAGLADVSGTKWWQLGLVNSSLQMVTSFDGNGWVQNQWGELETDLFAMAIQPDERIILAGYYGENIAMLRYLTDGSLDNSFSSDGKVITDFPGGTGERITAVSVAPSGAIFVAGTVPLDAGVPADRGFVGKYLANGNLDLAWGTLGFVTLHWGGTGSLDPWGFNFAGSSGINDMVIQSDGKIVVVGRSISGGQEVDWDFCVARLNADGTLDDSFAGDGKYRHGFTPTSNGANLDQAKSLTLDAAGGIIVAGEVQGITASRIGMLRLLANGDPDPDFGTDGNGTLVTSFGGSGHSIGQVTLDNQGQIVVVGGWRSSTSVSTNTFIARYIGTAVGILEFSLTNGVVNVFPNPIAESTTFNYTLVEPEQLTISLQDLQGRVITTFMNGRSMPAGEHKQTVSMPSDLAQGNYLLVFSTPKGRMSVQVSK